jgi:hypothetical protein
LDRLHNKLHNEELRDFYSSPSIVRMIKSRRVRLSGHVARVGAKGNSCGLLVGKSEGRRPLGRWKDEMRLALRGIAWIEWTALI